MILVAVFLVMASATAQQADDEYRVEGAVTSSGGSSQADDLRLDAVVGQPAASGLQRGGEFGLTGGVAPHDAAGLLPDLIFSDGFEPEGSP